MGALRDWSINNLLLGHLGYRDAPVLLHLILDDVKNTAIYCISAHRPMQL